MNSILALYTQNIPAKARDVLFYLVGLYLDGQTLPTAKEIGFKFETDGYTVLSHLHTASYLKGSANKYSISETFLHALCKPGNAPVAGLKTPMSVLHLLKYFKQEHDRLRSVKATVAINDLVCMRSICKHIIPVLVEQYITDFFADPITRSNKYTAFGVNDFKKFLYRRKYLLEVKKGKK